MSLLHPFHEFPIHLYHKEKPAIVANDAETRDKALADGFGTEYVPQDYPKMVHAEVADAKEQAMAQAHGFVYSGAVDAPYPHTVSRTFKSAEEEHPVAVAPDEKAVEVPEGE